MALISSQQIARLMNLNYEPREMEVKGAGTWKADPELTHKVIRAILGMSNLLDGGTVIVGISETPAGFRVDGLDSAQSSTWDRDHIGEMVRQFAEPMVDFDVEPIGYDGKRLIAIRVYEFEECPILCRRDKNDSSNRTILRNGACYTRPKGKGQTVEVSDYQDMRDLLDRAVDKRLRQLAAQETPNSINIEDRGAAPDNSFYRAQIDQFFGEDCE